MNKFNGKMGSKLTLVMAYDLNKLVGRGNTLPWNIREDLLNFKKTTTSNKNGNIIVMGFNTLKSFKGRVLPDRVNVVISKNPDAVIKLGYEISCDPLDLYRDFNGVVVFETIEMFLNVENIKKQSVFIIGGMALVNYCLDNHLIKEAIITEIGSDYGIVDGDVVFNASLIDYFNKLGVKIDEIDTSCGVQLTVYKYHN